MTRTSAATADCRASPTRLAWRRWSSAFATTSATKACEGVTDVFALAALYCVAIARGHAFLDANKRTAVNCTWAFLKMNGVKASVPENLVETVIRTATGEMDAQKAAEYLRAAFGEK